MSLKPPVSAGDHIRGSKNAVIELVEYGDYQCPHCGRAYPIIKSIERKFGDELKFVFRNFPLSEIHPQAKIAAIAAEAANRQNKFWPMHDIIFENQQRLGQAALIEYAKLIDLNVEQFKDDLTNDNLAQKVEDDFESGLRSGVNGTPGFFINGKKYNDSWDKESLEAYIKAKIVLL